MLALKIKDNRYGQAIALLLRLGGGFQTRHQRTLIVNSSQRRILEEAGCVEKNDKRLKRKDRGEK